MAPGQKEGHGRYHSDTYRCSKCNRFGPEHAADCPPPKGGVKLQLSIDMGEEFRLVELAVQEWRKRHPKSRGVRAFTLKRESWRHKTWSYSLGYSLIWVAYCRFCRIKIAATEDCTYCPLTERPDALPGIPHNHPYLMPPTLELTNPAYLAQAADLHAGACAMRWFIGLGDVRPG